MPTFSWKRTRVIPHALCSRTVSYRVSQKKAESTLKMNAKPYVFEKKCGSAGKRNGNISQKEGGFKKDNNAEMIAQKNGKTSSLSYL